MYLKLNGIEMCCDGTERWCDLLERLPDKGAGALGVCIQGRTYSLAASVEEYAYARILTLADEEGRRIYERSLQFLFLAAMHRLYPQARVRIQHSFGAGIYIDVTDLIVTEEMLTAVDAEMRRMVAMDLPIARLDMSTAGAAKYFEETGQKNRLRILGYREFKHFTMYALEGYEDYFYGEMVPSTGYVGVFELVKYAPGLVLMQPSAANPAQVAPFKDLPKLMKTYAESAEWMSILGCENAADLNDMVVDRRLREFIRVNEALQEQKIGRIAEQFIESGARVMLIAGPSSSGKTTFAHRLSIALRVHGLRPVKLSLDDYYRNRDSLPVEEDGSLDLERLDTLDVELLCEHLPRLLAGETVQIPEYDFKTGMRMEHTHPLQVE